MHKQREKPYNDNDLDRLTPTERAVLQAYYETDRTWEQVADMLHYSVARVFQIRRLAIEKCVKNGTKVAKNCKKLQKIHKNV